MSEDIDRMLDIAGDAATGGDAPPTSKLANAAVWTGGIACLSGFLTIACGPVRKGEWQIFNVPGWVGWVILLTVLFGLLALLLAMAGALRIVCSHHSRRGYPRCLAAVSLAILGNIVWITVLFVVLA